MLQNVVFLSFRSPSPNIMTPFMYNMTFTNIHIFSKGPVHTWVGNAVKAFFFPICLSIPGAAIHKGRNGTLLYARLIFRSVEKLVCTKLNRK